jgi:hypothetical protein
MAISLKPKGIKAPKSLAPPMKGFKHKGTGPATSNIASGKAPKSPMITIGTDRGAFKI